MIPLAAPPLRLEGDIVFTVGDEEGIKRERVWAEEWREEKEGAEREKERKGVFLPAKATPEAQATSSSQSLSNVTLPSQELALYLPRQIWNCGSRRWLISRLLAKSATLVMKSCFCFLFQMWHSPSSAVHPLSRPFPLPWGTFSSQP